MVRMGRIQRLVRRTRRGATGQRLASVLEMLEGGVQLGDEHVTLTDEYEVAEELMCGFAQEGEVTST